MQTDLTRKKTQRAKRIWRGQRDRLRGFSTNRKIFSLAIFVELAIITAGVWAGIYFANRYASDTAHAVQVAVIGGGWQHWISQATSSDWYMALIGALMLCAAELARIPLAMAFRTHRSAGIRIVALLGVIMMILVTAKGVSQVLASAYHPRLIAVAEAKSDLKQAEADLAVIASKRGSADVALEPVQKRVDEANARISELNALIAQQGEAPKPRPVKKSVKGTCWNKRHTKKWSCPRTVTTYVVDAWAGAPLVEKLDAANAERDAAVIARDAAASGVASEVESVAEQDRVVVDLRDKHRRAVMDSQLHDLASVLLFKDAVDLTEEEMSTFLFIFIVIPSLLIAAASTMLAFCAFTRHPRRRSAVEVPRSEDGTLAAFIRDTAKRSVAVPLASIESPGAPLHSFGVGMNGKGAV